MWDVKYMIISVITEATGKAKKVLKKNLKAIPGKHSIDSLPKTCILGTCGLSKGPPIPCYK
jgi:hypothetical protein